MLRWTLSSCNPRLRYAKAGEIHIAYQVFGDGPIDMVLATEFWHSIEVQWDQPDLAAFPRAPRLVRTGDLVRPARKRRLRPSRTRRADVARPLDGRHPCRDGRGRVGERGLLRSRRWRNDGHAVRGDPSRPCVRARPRRTALPVSSGLTTIRRDARAEARGRGVMDVMRTGWGKGVFLDLIGA